MTILFWSVWILLGFVALVLAKIISNNSSIYDIEESPLPLLFILASPLAFILYLAEWTSIYILTKRKNKRLAQEEAKREIERKRLHEERILEKEGLTVNV